MSEAEEFLEWLRPGGPWVLTAINPEQKGVLETVTVGPGKVEPFVKKHDGRWNIYYHVNPVLRPMEKKAKKSDVVALEFLYVDIDPRVGEELDAEQGRILAKLNGAASAIVFSGGGYQALWRLKEPIRLDGDVSLAEDAERYIHQLEIDYEGDILHNVDRIFRLPGTINVLDAKKRAKKRKEGVRAKAVSLTDASFDIATFKQVPPKKAVPEVVAVQTIEDVAELDQWNVPDRIRVIIVQGDHPDEKKPSRSEWLFDAVCGLVRAKVPDAVILSILTDAGFGISESVLEKGPNPSFRAKNADSKARLAANPDWRTNHAAAMRANHALRLGYESCDPQADLARVRAEVGDEFTRADWKRIIGKHSKAVRDAVKAGLLERSAHGRYRFAPQPTQGDHTAALGVAAE